MLDMDVQLTSDQQAKLTRMAKQGRAAEKLVQEAVERLLNYDEWFSREVDRGLAAADRGEFVEHGAFVGITSELKEPQRWTDRHKTPIAFLLTTSPADINLLN